MALWICRAGKLGEHETRFIEDNRIYCTWDDLHWDMSSIAERELMKEKLTEIYSGVAKEKTILNWLSQLWAFSHGMSVGDLVAMPSKLTSPHA